MQIRSRRRAATWLPVLTGLLGCASDPTGLRLHVDSDLDVPAELEGVVIRIEPEGGAPGDGIGLYRRVVLGEDTELPIVIGIAPAAGDDGHRVHVVVQPIPGPALDVDLEPFHGLVPFEAGAVRDLYVQFPGPCTVRDGSTCGEPCDVDAVCDVSTWCVTPDSCPVGPCETASCVEGRCVAEYACGDSESCCAGDCVPAGCDDGDRCTIDWCDEAAGCMHRDDGSDAYGREIDGCPAT